MYFKLDDFVMDYIFSEIKTPIEEFKAAKLIVSNIGGFDEDIDLQVIIPKDYLVKIKDRSVSKLNIIKEILDKNFIEVMFSIKENHTINII
ncbi:hypothetical protein AAT16_10180 [Salinicoccus halodurans]|uniref:Uncharacterized protein n=2 Tax=Salinicoccus halodurans TaxID=407035 RepID=A0ABN4G8A6_9STAP|nr:hypothetical protein AAT16_10180 [Salinicoccus halodurans]